jgi:hypothetical protein
MEGTDESRDKESTIKPTVKKRQDKKHNSGTMA